MTSKLPRTRPRVLIRPATPACMNGNRKVIELAAEEEELPLAVVGVGVNPIGPDSVVEEVAAAAADDALYEDNFILDRVWK